MRLYADVVLDLPIPGPFTYRVPGPLHPRTTPGIRVRVPFRRRAMTGVVVSLRKKRPASSFEMKEILEALDEGPVFSSEFLAFTRKLSASYHSSWGEMLLSALPASLVLRSRKEVAITPEGQKALEEGSLQEAEKTVLEIVEHRAYTTTFLRRKARVENVSAVLRRLEKKGLIAFHEILKTPVRKHRAEVSRPPLQLEIDFSLDERSLSAGKRLRAAMNSRKFSPFYVHASSGKREGIYAYLIREALASKRKVLFLVPEISLTSSLQKSFERKLGERALLFHSRLTEAQREQAWRRVREGGADVVVGSRSALFSPVENLGVIIVDDEHEEAYQQRESPSFDARKGAWLRAEQTASLLVYGSSVPSVEMYHRARRRGMILRLDEKSGEAVADVIGVRIQDGRISPGLCRAIETYYRQKEPVILFVNRRGYAAYVTCSRCGHVPRCAQCHTALHYHKREGKLLCHYCGFSSSGLQACPSCGGRLILGRSYGIEAYEEAVRREFPKARVASFGPDLLRKKQERQKILERFSRKKIDILLGTPLLAYQENFSQVAMVGVLHPEVLLGLPDFQASQKAFQAISGMRRFLKRGEGKLVIQTTDPDHYSIRCAARGAYDDFFREEIRFRRVMGYPPFRRMAEVFFWGQSLRSLARDSRRFVASVTATRPDVDVLGPALAAGVRVKGKYRVQVILKASRKSALDEALERALPAVRSRRSVFVYE